ncbi:MULTISPECIES: SusC/RagA family TonB-linked outer membrane protein [Chitinophagaceae]
MGKKLFGISLMLMSLFLTFTVVNAQQKVITGTVLANNDNTPIPGASITVPGTRIGRPTDDQGRFQLNVPQSAKEIRVSAIGYLTQKITIGSQTDYVVKLDVYVDTTADAVIVTANNIKRDKRSLGYSAPVINSSELMEGNNFSPLTALSGKVSGVNITSTSNSPGSSTRIVLRGGSSIAGNNQALLVVDGVPIDNTSQIGGGSTLSSVDFGNRGNDLDPNDIASVTVLKGPAAAALYGSRASNGALIIVTKSGQASASKRSMTFSSTNTLSSILKLPDFQNEYGQGYYDDVDANGNLTYINDPRENGSWGAPFTGATQEWGQMIDGKRLSKPYSAIKNNVKDFFSTGFASTNNLSMSAATDKSGYYLAIGTLNSNGVYPGNYDNFNKYSVRFNGHTDLGNNFSSAVTFNYIKVKSSNPMGGQGDGSIYNNLLQTPRDIPVTDLKDLSNKYYGYGITTADGVHHDDLYGYYGAYTMNPYYVLQNFKNLDNMDRLTGSFTLTYKPKSWLKFEDRLGTDVYFDRRELMAPKYTFYPADEEGTYYSSQNAQISNGNYEQDKYNVTEVVNDLMATATHEFNEDFGGSLILGNNIRQRTTSTSELATNSTGGLVVPGWYNLNNSNGALNIITDYSSKRRLIGLYAQVDLHYKNFLFLNATARNDWSSTLPKDNRSFFYPSVSGSFIFTELMKGSSLVESGALSYGKLRASWAQVGNDADPYLDGTYYSRAVINGSFGSTTFPFNGVPGLMTGSTIGNKGIRPEITTSYEFGTELGFFKNRLTLDFSYYQNKSKDQILTIPIPASTGFSYQVVNAGAIRNRGVELSLRGTPIKTQNITWELYGTFSKNVSKVLYLQDGVTQYSLGGFSGMSVVAAVGRPYGEFYSVPDAKDAQGRTIIDPSTGLPNPADSAQFLGTYNPKYQASWGTNFRYKNWSVSALFDMKHGGVFFSRTKDIMDFVGTAAETGGNRNPQIFPNSVYLDASGNSVVNTDYTYIKQDYYGSMNPGEQIVDASYIKLRSLSISYSLPKSALKNSVFGDVSFGLFGNNLFIWTPSSNKYADPEVNSAGAGNLQGFDFTAQPSVRNYGFNLKVSF